MRFQEPLTEQHDSSSQAPTWPLLHSVSASGPSNARSTSATVMSAAGCASVKPPLTPRCVSRSPLRASVFSTLLTAGAGRCSAAAISLAECWPGCIANCASSATA